MSSQSINILFASSEATPYIKTGGLADVSGSLPPVIKGLGHDIRLILPAYPAARKKLGEIKEVAVIRLPGHPDTIRLLEGHSEDGLPVYLVDCPDAFDREGNPYVDKYGNDWADNHLRFTIFSRVVTAVALDHSILGWKPDVVHTNDWQTGLVPALLHQEMERPATVFTVHNLSYFGLCDRQTFDDLDLPGELWDLNGLEFHGKASFLKAGIAYADEITTVSPTYAKEIRTSEFGYGLEGLLDFRAGHLTGIINGIDYNVWNPAMDLNLRYLFDTGRLGNRAGNKQELQKTFGLPVRDDVMLFGYIGRLVDQKGVDLILSILPRLQIVGDVQIVFLGTGSSLLEHALRGAEKHFSDMVACRIGYDEPLAHMIEGGCDALLMPSRYEPCGLNQLYSLRYGCIPIAHETGGLADTVIDFTHKTRENDTATGFTFKYADAEGLWYAVERAIICYHRTPKVWKELMLRGMKSDFSWGNSARRYLELYQRATDRK
jgi:starch synthase